MPGYLDRQRAARLMQEQGLAALLLAQPESISYAAGAFPGVATYWRRAGAAFLLVPADPAAPLAAIVGDLQARDFARQSGIADTRSHRIWVEAGPPPGADPERPRRTPRPAQFSLATTLGLLHDLLAERGLLDQPVGLELGFIPAADYPAFSALPLRWQDATRLVERLRAVKAPGEIEHLRRAATYARAGMLALFESARPGLDAAQLTSIWRDAAFAEAARLGHPPPQSSWAYIAVGGDGFAPGGPLQPGDLVKIDVGCVVSGYSSDGARTAVLGQPSPTAARLYDGLRHAFDTGLALLRPGTPLAEIYQATATAMWDQGYETYGRGHFGHGVGASIWSEEWPFIAADAEAVLEPGMVMAFETPWYVDGMGGLIIEDQLLITDSGAEVMAPLPRDLVRLGQTRNFHLRRPAMSTPEGLHAELGQLVSETRNPRSATIDLMSSLEIVTTMNAEDRLVPEAVAATLPQIARAVDAIVEAFEAGGRLIYVGAGTSGRLGVLDASECPPTFGTPPELVLGLIAGGDTALRNAVEGAEDDAGAGAADLDAVGLGARDIIVGIAVSGRTPYVIGALQRAKEAGARTVALTCNPASPIAQLADISIAPVVGPEVVTGSTRLKSGTAQKLVLNMLSTASMVRRGKTYGNLMVDMIASNRKLEARAARMVAEATGAGLAEATAALEAAGYSSKLAILMLLTGQDADAARQALEAAGGVLRRAIPGATP